MLGLSPVSPAHDGYAANHPYPTSSTEAGQVVWGDNPSTSTSDILYLRTTAETSSITRSAGELVYSTKPTIHLTTARLKRATQPPNQ